MPVAEHASAQKWCNLYSYFAAFTNGFSRSHIQLMYKSIISRILNDVLDNNNNNNNNKNKQTKQSGMKTT